MRSIPSLGQVRLLCRSIVLCRLPRSSVIARDGVCLKRLLVTLLANLTLYYFLLLYLGGEGALGLFAVDKEFCLQPLDSDWLFRK